MTITFGKGQGPTTIITDREIEAQYVTGALSECIGEYDTTAITAALLDLHPLHEWEYEDGQYSHPSGTPTFWDIVAENPACS